MLAHGLNKGIRCEAPYDARQVANFVLDEFVRRDHSVTLLKLQKILFYSYGWYIAANKKKLFHNPIEAWKYGPVVRVVSAELSGGGDAPLSRRATFLDLKSGEKVVAPAALLAEDGEFVSAIVSEYLHIGAWALSEMTHEQASPWFSVWHSVGGSANLGMRISDDEIFAYFVNHVRLPIRA
jgi:uncharacterized phage-associated protein